MKPEENAAEILARLTEEKKRELDQIVKLQRILDKYPDLKQHKDRWERVRYATPLVNGIVTDCEITHNCGCCPDSSLEAWPYLEAEGIRVYADPTPFWIGERNHWNGELSRVEWDIPMRDAGIPEAVIKKVQQFFDENMPDLEGGAGKLRPPSTVTERRNHE